MNTTTTLLTAAALFGAFTVNAATINTGPGVIVSAIDGVNTTLETRHSTQLNPGTYELAVRYGIQDHSSNDASYFHSERQIITVNVQDSDLTVSVPSYYADPEVAAYHFARSPQIIVK
ncbi:DUF2057 family protein [Alginatibacterium sediminis]|nr:DUF2057 family protein [Alginatibacterium sediminis]